MRKTFHGELDHIGRTLVDMTAAVDVAMRDATRALLGADLTLAEKVISGDAQVDGLRDDLEARAFDLLARQQPVAVDLRTMRHSAAQLCSPATRRVTVVRASGVAANTDLKYWRISSRPRSMPTGTMSSTPSSRQWATMASTSRLSIASK